VEERSVRPDSEPETLLELLVRWEELRQQGKELTPEELCPDDARLQALLRERLARRQRLHAALDLPGVTRPAPVAGPAPLPVIDGYEIGDLLGRGGMGLVFKATQTALKRPVALKIVVSGAHAGAEERARFRTEAEAIARLSHPGIVGIYEVGEQAGCPYLALEFVAGGTLAQQLGGTPVPPRRAAQLLLELARAVQHAHEQGIVHRDLKPANVLLTESGVAKVADFGLAKLLDAEGQTHTGAVLGSPSYMAPEQAAGRVRAIGPATDVYALGAILYELLTGRPPFAAATVEATVAQVRQDEPVPPRRLQPTVPRDLETICLKCLEKDPRRRYPTAAALAEDLRRFLAGEPILARPLSAAGRLVRWVRRHPTRAALLAVSVIAALASAGAAVGMVYNARLQDANGRLEAANGELSTALGDAKVARDGEAAEKQRALEALDKKERMAALLRVARAGIEARANRMADARRLLTEVPPDRRGWEWRYLRDQSEDHAVEFRGHVRPATQVAFDPAHPRAATAGMDGTVRLWDTTSARELARLSIEGGAPLAVAFSPDGARLAAAGHGGRVRVWATPPGGEPNLLHTLSGHEGIVWSVAFSPDGGLLASAGNDQTVRIWDAATGTAGPVLRGSQAVARQVTFNTKRKTVLAVFDGQGVTPQLWEWDPATGNGQVRAEGKKPNGWLPALAVRPHSDEIAAFLGDGTITIWTAGWQLAREVSLDRDAVDGLAWSWQNIHLAAARRDGSVHVFDTYSWGPVAILPRHGGEVLSVAFDPASQRVASCGYDGRVILADAVPGRPPVVISRPSGLSSATFRADGRQLAAGGYDGTIWLVDPATGKESAPPLPVPPGLTSGQRVRSLAFSPVGGVLAAAWKDDPVVRIWDGPNKGPELRHDDPVHALVFRQDGGQLATASKDEVRLWEPATGKLLDRLKAPPGILLVCAIAYHPDGRHLIACGGQSVDRAHTEWVWDLVAGGRPRVYRMAPEEYQVHSFGVLADGMVPGPTRDFGLSLFDPTGARPTRVIYPDGTGQVWAVHPDGRLMAVARRTGGIALWDGREDAEVYSIPLAGRTVARLAFDPTGRRLAVIDTASNLFVLDAPPEK
jgi:WD40 repeat protein